MIELLQKIFIGNAHKWVVTKEMRLTKDHDFGAYPTGTRYHCQCTVCGKVKKRDLI